MTSLYKIKLNDYHYEIFCNSWNCHLICVKPDVSWKLTLKFFNRFMIMDSPWVGVDAFTSQQVVTLVTLGCTGKLLFLETGSVMTLMSAMLAATVMLLPISLSCQDTIPTNSQKLDQVINFTAIILFLVITLKKLCPDDRCTINTNKRYTISHTHSKVFK